MPDSAVSKNTQPNEQPSMSATVQAEAELLAKRPWIKHYEEGVPVHLEIPDQPLTWLLDETVRRHPDKTAFIYYGTRISYARFAALANRFAAALQRLGIKKGDRVAIALPNIPQYPIAFYGTLRLGAVAVPTNPLYTEREMQHQMADSGARVLIMLDMFYPVVRAIRDKTALEHIIITSPADFLPPLLRTLYPLSQRRERHKQPQPPLTKEELRSDPKLLLMSDLLKPTSAEGIEVFTVPDPPRSSDLAVLQYTGGTTGLSKGAMLTHRNLLANAYQTRYWTPRAHDAGETGLCVAPFFHSYGLTVGLNLGILAAASMVLLPQFKPKEVVRAIKRYRPTMFPGIPTMYIAIMREAGKDSSAFQSIRYCISGAAPLPAKVRHDFESLSGGRLVEGYGLSEASPVTHCNPLNGDVREGSIGLPLPEVDAAIMDPESGKLLPPGEIGELVVRGPNIMQGYWNRKEETAAIFRDGWMRTGDLGKMDEEGYFYLVERAKDMILASGFNVYPREVEEVLFRHPAVQEAAVVGVPDEYRGETVAAFIVLKPGVAANDATRQDIVSFCRKELTAYKVPKIVEFRESLPKSLIGKVLRRELREQWLQQRGAGQKNN
uniref:Long-chain-fatty-acid--CoA ligase n=1 Tax=Thermogemmatispora argillosa TaxID=2045280 RepID=A0A455T1W3_9CHLR|nr:long-chain-fatty-acid--CoA ligase [Thermogemmatispora argillosa]